MGRKKPFTPEQIDMIEKMASVRMPMVTIAGFLDVSKDCLEKRAKKDKVLQAAIDKGRTKGTMKVYQTAFQLATGYKRAREVFDQEKGKMKTLYEDVPPDPVMLKFWLKTQEKWRETDRLELTGKDGAPLTVATLPAADRKREIARLEGLRAHLAIVAAAQLHDDPIDVTPLPEEPERDEEDESEDEEPEV